MEEYSIDDYKNVIILKNQLLTMDIDQLKTLYQSYDLYLLFLDIVSVLTSIDCGFLLLQDDIIPKIERMIVINRFETDSDTFDTINQMIQYFNITKNYSSKRKKILSQSYLAYQEDIRQIQFEDMNDFYEAIAYDANLVLALEQEDLEFINQDKYFMSSLNYIIESVPEIIYDSLSYNIIKDRLESIRVRHWPFDSKKRHSLEYTRENFQKKKKKEE